MTEEKVRTGNNAKLLSTFDTILFLCFFVLQIFGQGLALEGAQSPAVEKSIPKVLSIILPLAQTDFHPRFASYRCAWHLKMFDWRFIPATDFVWRDGIKIMPISHLVWGHWDVEYIWTGRLDKWKYTVYCIKKQCYCQSLWLFSRIFTMKHLRTNPLKSVFVDVCILLWKATLQKSRSCQWDGAQSVFEHLQSTKIVPRPELSCYNLTKTNCCFLSFGMLHWKINVF